ncbi:hypothetical protein [Streptomyces sp. NPDC002994]|uniref:hypothetical protein n=1 Tax=Streptomyces sp. NPDC002994 TaxID=3154441 RepID=UPI0033B85AE8
MMFIRVTYTYSAGSTVNGVASCVRLDKPNNVLDGIEKARRKNQLIRIVDREQGTAHAFPASRLISVAVEPAKDAS